MVATTAWVAPAKTGTGLDHLAVQAPSTRMYSQLVPGITNVTDRAAYFSFYPWLFWAWEQRQSTVQLSLEQLVRRGEVLFTLVAERHARALNEDDARHGIGMVGRSKLVPALRGLVDGDQIPLARFAAVRDGGEPLSYFQNRLGGLGQYYLGPLRDLGVLATSEGRHGYTPERGEGVARALAARAPADAFFRALERGATSPAELDAMSSLCPCQLSSNAREVEVLLDLLLDRKNEQPPEAHSRRESIALMLDLLAHRPPNIVRLTGERWCRSSAYGNAWSAGERWILPPRLERLRVAWGAYERHELFSIALQTIFWTALHVVAKADDARVASVERVADLVRGLAERAFGGQVDAPLELALRERTAALPPIADWHEDAHESAVADRALIATRDEDAETALVAAFDILLVLVARQIPDEPYVDFRFEDGYFIDYPLHLRRFRTLIDAHRQRWTLGDLIRHLATEWGVHAHFRVALRKLHGEALDTFRLRPLDNELVWVASPEPTWTNPRLQNIERFLVDLGLASWVSKGPATLTEAGHAILEAHRG